MEIKVQRKETTDDYTMGELYIDDELICATLEDTVRPIGYIVEKETAIPAGRYNVIIDNSKKFHGNEMIHILDVPHFPGARIHSGNTTDDTEGCILVGNETSTPGQISGGLNLGILENVFNQVKTALDQGEEVFITVLD